VIEVNELTKRFGGVTAVDGLTFAVEPGRVTGFLGPNGAGKSTTLRMILGLNAPTRGTATVAGRPFRLAGAGLRLVGALLDAGDVHRGRSARAHLAALARSNGIGRDRVAAVLREVGLEDAARRRVGGFSLGMRQRLGIAAALLGDPPVLIFDEPINGLDVEGIAWARALFRRLAAEGRTVFVSSHMMSEVEHTADHLIVIGGGKLIADEPLERFAARATRQTVRVRTDEPERLARALAAQGAAVATEDERSLTVTGLTTLRIGQVAAEAGITVYEATATSSALEAAFMESTAASVEFHAGRA
jgi:ABC-2 type transport system ATP-binding protein